MRISDWSSDVCSSDLDLLRTGQIKARPAMRLIYEQGALALLDADRAPGPIGMRRAMEVAIGRAREFHVGWCVARDITHAGAIRQYVEIAAEAGMIGLAMRPEEHTSELQSLMRISYAVF